MRNPFRRHPARNIVRFRAEDGTVLHTIHLDPPTWAGPNTLDIVVPEGTYPDCFARIPRTTQDQDAPDAGESTP